MSHTNTALETQISQLLDIYLASFNAGDFTKAASYYHEPSVAISASGVSILPAQKDLSTFLSTTVTRLKQEGFHHSEWSGPKKIIVLEHGKGKGLLLASCGCKRLREDGTSCEEFTATYTLRMVDGEWRIAGILQHPIETQLK